MIKVQCDICERIVNPDEVTKIGNREVCPLCKEHIEQLYADFDATARDVQATLNAQAQEAHQYVVKIKNIQQEFKGYIAEAKAGLTEKIIEIAEQKTKQ